MLPTIQEATSTYDLCRTLLAALGCDDVIDAYRALPKMHARTLRRIFKEGVLMYTSKDELTEVHPIAPVHKDSTLEPGQELELIAAAKAANVQEKVAVRAVRKFRNPVAWVTQVLADVRAIRLHGGGINNPTGLFVSAMRTGQDLTLPDRVLLAREVAAKVNEEAKKTVAVGQWYHLDGDWWLLESIDGVKCTMYAPLGHQYNYVYEDTRMNANLDRLRNARASGTCPMGHIG